MNTSFKLFLALIAFASLASCSKEPNYIQGQSENRSLSEPKPSSRSNSKPEAIVFRAAGDISASLEGFRELLGTLNTAPGVQGGRREVNWDGVPDMFTNNDRFPGDFFGAVDPALPNGRKRGLINTTPGTGFSISNNDFFFLNPKYDDQFNDFSPARTFVAVGSAITDNFFKVPGSNVDATVQGFGVVFSDVNNAASTWLEFYDGEILLGSFKV